MAVSSPVVHLSVGLAALPGARVFGCAMGSVCLVTSCSIPAVFRKCFNPPAGDPVPVTSAGIGLPEPLADGGVGL